jgi:alpha-tubulin suppressor-like RCC1 family protein
MLEPVANPSQIQKTSGLPKIWKQVSAGDNHTCAIAIGGKAYCWGFNNVGQLGDGTNNNSLVPVPVYTGGVLSGKTVKSISVSDSFACVIASDSKLYCWGNGGNGRLGRGSTTSSNVPVAVNTLGVLNGKNISALSLGWHHACALATDQKVYCWGYGTNGQLGNNTTADSTSPVAVSLASLNVSKLEAGSNHTCIIDTSSKVYCWGADDYGQLGDNSTTYKPTPVSIYMGGNIPSSYTIRDITAGWAHTCVVVNENERVYCWGDDTYYQVGTNTVMSRFTVPMEIDPAFGFDSSKRVSKFLSGSNHTCILDTLGDLYCWGDGTYYQNGSMAAITKPAKIGFSGTPLQGKTIKSMGQGTANHSCVIASDDQIYCWGYNYYSQLGNNLTANSATFVSANQVP